VKDPCEKFKQTELETTLSLLATMSKPDRPAEYTDSLSASDLYDAGDTHVFEIEDVHSVRTMLIQAIALFTATMVHVLRRQKTLVFGYSLDNWAVMPPECVLFTVLVFILGGPIMKRDFRMIRKLLCWGV
jgi:hypothetical protein